MCPTVPSSINLRPSLTGIMAGAGQLQGNIRQNNGGSLNRWSLAVRNTGNPSSCFRACWPIIKPTSSASRVRRFVPYYLCSGTLPLGRHSCLSYGYSGRKYSLLYTRLVIQSGFYVDPLCLTMKLRPLLRMDMYVFIVLHILRSWDCHVTHVPVIQLPSDSAESSRCPFWLGDMTKVLRRRLDMCMKP